MFLEEYLIFSEGFKSIMLFFHCPFSSREDLNCLVRFHYLVSLILLCICSRQQDRYYSGDLLMMRDESEITGMGGASENPSHLYEYRDTPSIAEKQPQLKVQMHPRPVPPELTKAPSVKTGSNQSLKSLKDSVNGFPSGEPKVETRPPLPQPVVTAPVPTTRLRGTLSRTHLEGGIPQTEV